jgi:hypothetical protein
MGSGKTTVAFYLFGYWGYEVVPFAETMKEMSKILLRAYGYSPNQVYHYFTTGKGEPLTKIPGHPTLRHIWQTLGTEWGRNLIHKDLWDALWPIVATERGRYVVADDVRKINEYKTIKSIPGAQIWRITRQSAKVTSAHSSEGELDNVVADHELTNDGTVAELHAKIDAILEGCKRP